MLAIKRAILLLSLPLLLTACRSQKSVEEPATVAVAAARTGAEWSSRIARGVDLKQLRSSSLLGVFASAYLTRVSTFRTALLGIQALYPLMFDESLQQSSSFALLEELSSILQIDIPDLLNRSTNRPRTFDAYSASLEDLLRRSVLELQRLEQELEQINDNRRSKRERVGGIQHELNLALQRQDYTTAEQRQRQLIEAEKELAGVEAKEDEQRSIIRIFEDFMEIGQDRLIAMRENREVLIAGLKVVEVPGIEDLRLLEEGKRRSRRRGGEYNWLFEDL